MSSLYVFALNGPSDLRYTHLTRAKAELVALPPLAEWLGTAVLDATKIELFPVKDLDDTLLSDYVMMAFAPEEDLPRETRERMDALEGSVLLVASEAIEGAPVPTASLTQIAEVILAKPDHSAELPKVATDPIPRPEPDPTPPPTQPRRGIGMLVMAIISVIIFFGLFLL